MNFSDNAQTFMQFDLVFRPSRQFFEKAPQSLKNVNLLGLMLKSLFLESLSLRP